MPDNATFYWNELVTHDVEGAKKFYQSVLGWTVEEMPMPSGHKYNVMKMGGKPVCGIMSAEATGMHDQESDEEGGDSSWLGYIHVDDVDKTVAKVEAAGGGIIKPCFDIPNVGRFAVVEDATGAVIGLATAKA